MPALLSGTLLPFVLPRSLNTKLNTKCKFALLPMMFPYLVISEWEFRDETFPSCSQPASETPFSSY